MATAKRASKAKTKWTPVPARALPLEGHVVAFECGIRLVNELNVREHWRGKAARKADQRAAAALHLAPIPWRWDGRSDLEIVITRIAPKAFDRGDNRESCAKATRDQVASWLGVDDNDRRLTWVVREERGPVRTYGTRVQIREVTAATRVADLRAQLAEAEAALRVAS